MSISASMSNLLAREAHQAEVGRAKEVEAQLAEAYRSFKIIMMMALIMNMIGNDDLK